MKTTCLALLLATAAIATVPSPPAERPHALPAVAPSRSAQPGVDGPTGYCAPPPDLRRELHSELKRINAARIEDTREAWLRTWASGVPYILNFETQAAFHGQPTPPQHQDAGTCTSRAAKEAIEDSLATGACAGRILSRPARVCYELFYGGARTEPDILNGRLGQSDGCFQAAIAVYLLRHGAIARGNWAGVDLSQEDTQEHLAVQWGSPGNRVPPEIEAAAIAAGQHVNIAAWPLETREDIADALAVGCGVAIEGTVPGGPRDEHGMSSGKTPGHSIAVCGVFKRPDGRLAFLCRQSWGVNGVTGPDQLVTDVGPVTLPPGYFGYDAQALIDLVDGAMAYLVLDDAFSPLSSPLELLHDPLPRAVFPDLPDPVSDRVRSRPTQTFAAAL